MKPPEDFKTKWVAALRSGEYKQTTHTLTFSEIADYIEKNL